MGFGFGVNEKGTGVNGELKTGKRVLDGDEKWVCGYSIWEVKKGTDKGDGGG